MYTHAYREKDKFADAHVYKPYKTESIAEAALQRASERQYPLIIRSLPGPLSRPPLNKVHRGAAAAAAEPLYRSHCRRFPRRQPFQAEEDNALT